MGRYLDTLGSAATRLLNSLGGGDRRGESTSSAIGRKAQEGRRLFIALEAIVNLPFAFAGKRNHCFEQYLKEMTHD